MQRRTAEPTARCCSAPTAVGRRCTRTKKGTAPERSAHRGSCGASLKNTARGTPKVRRTCGWQRRFRSSLPRPVDPGTGPVRGRVALVPRGAKVRGSLATPASRAPSDFFWGDAQGGKEGGPGAFLQKSGPRSVGYFLRPPLPGGGTPAGAKRRRGGVGPCRKLRARGESGPTPAPPDQVGGRRPSPCRGG